MIVVWDDGLRPVRYSPNDEERPLPKHNNEIPKTERVMTPVVKITRSTE